MLQRVLAVNNQEAIKRGWTTVALEKHCRLRHVLCAQELPDSGSVVHKQMVRRTDSTPPSSPLPLPRPPSARRREDVVPEPFGVTPSRNGQVMRKPTFAC